MIFVKTFLMQNFWYVSTWACFENIKISSSLLLSKEEEIRKKSNLNGRLFYCSVQRMLRELWRNFKVLAILLVK